MDGFEVQYSKFCKQCVKKECTEANKVSSRGHTITEFQMKDAEGKRAKLSVVDLAGQERELDSRIRRKPNESEEELKRRGDRRVRERTWINTTVGSVITTFKQMARGIYYNSVFPKEGILHILGPNFKTSSHVLLIILVSPCERHDNILQAAHSFHQIFKERKKRTIIGENISLIQSVQEGEENIESIVQEQKTAVGAFEALEKWSKIKHQKIVITDQCMKIMLKFQLEWKVVLQEILKIFNMEPDNHSFVHKYIDLWAVSQETEIWEMIRENIPFLSLDCVKFFVDLHWISREKDSNGQNSYHRKINTNNICRVLKCVKESNSFTKFTMKEIIKGVEKEFPNLIEEPLKNPGKTRFSLCTNTVEEERLEMEEWEPEVLLSASSPSHSPPEQDLIFSVQTPQNSFHQNLQEESPFLRNHHLERQTKGGIIEIIDEGEANFEVEEEGNVSITIKSPILNPTQSPYRNEQEEEEEENDSYSSNTKKVEKRKRKVLSSYSFRFHKDSQLSEEEKVKLDKYEIFLSNYYCNNRSARMFLQYRGWALNQ